MAKSSLWRFLSESRSGAGIEYLPVLSVISAKRKGPRRLCGAARLIWHKRRDSRMWEVGFGRSLEGRRCICQKNGIAFMVLTQRLGFPHGRTAAADSSRGPSSVASGIDRAIDEKSDYDSEFRILPPDTAVRYIHSVGHPVFGSS